MESFHTTVALIGLKIKLRLGFEIAGNFVICDDKVVVVDNNDVL